jgi:hypothetical protein
MMWRGMTEGAPFLTGADTVTGAVAYVTGAARYQWCVVA